MLRLHGERSVDDGLARNKPRRKQQFTIPPHRSHLVYDAQLNLDGRTAPHEEAAPFSASLGRNVPAAWHSRALESHATSWRFIALLSSHRSLRSAAMEQGLLFEPGAMLQAELRIAIERLDFAGASRKVEELRRLWPGLQLTWEPELVRLGMKFSRRRLGSRFWI